MFETQKLSRKLFQAKSIDRCPFQAKTVDRPVDQAFGQGVCTLSVDWPVDRLKDPNSRLVSVDPVNRQFSFSF